MTLLVVVRDAGGGLRHEASRVLSCQRFTDGRSRALSDCSREIGTRNCVEVLDGMTPRGPDSAPALFTQRRRGTASERYGRPRTYVCLFILLFKDKNEKGVEVEGAFQSFEER